MEELIVPMLLGLVGIVIILLTYKIGKIEKEIKMKGGKKWLYIRKFQ